MSAPHGPAPDSSPNSSSTAPRPVPDQPPSDLLPLFLFFLPLPSIAPPTPPGSASPPEHCPPPCTAIVPPDTSDPAARTLLPPSESPAAPPPSPLLAPHRSSPALPASLPLLSDNVPNDWLAHLILHNLTAGLHIPPPPHPGSSPLAPQTAHVHMHVPRTRPPSHSTPQAPASALRRSEDRSSQSPAPDPGSSPSAHVHNVAPYA